MMTYEEHNLPYIMTGCIFYAFGLKWCCEYARMYMPQYISAKPNPRANSKNRLSRMKRTCLNLISSHPLEGSLKLIATIVGLVGTLTGGLPDIGIVSAKVVHATIYLFFAFSGLVDVLNFYFPRNISDGFTKLALAQSFFIEGFLFVYGSVSENPTVNFILGCCVWLTSLAVCLEVIWPEALLIRGFTTLLHGAWVAHMVRVFRVELLTIEKIALTFSWHVAAASSTAMLVVAITRSCIPHIPPQEPPEVPIYDYCNELEIRP